MFTAYWNRCKADLRILGISLIGLMIIMTSNSTAAPVFKLKAPQDYFSDPQSQALLNAALAGDLNKAKQLVAQGANPNDEGPKDNPYNHIRLLHYAIAANNAQAVKVLMTVGADPELNAQGFGMALLFVMTLGNADLLGVMLDEHPISSLLPHTLKLMLFDSVESCHQCLALLLKRGAPIDFPNGAGETLLMDSMDEQDYDLAEWLILQGAAVVREPTIGGGTPANTVQFHLNKFIPGSPTYNKVLHLKQLMEARGAKFPALSPKEIREQRANKKVTP